MLTGLLTATPPSMRLNTRETGGVEFGSVSMKSTGGRYVGAAAVAWHTYFIGALSKSSLLAFHDEKKIGCWILVSKAGMTIEVRAELMCWLSSK
jgi:hypothetical protein